MDKRIVAFLNGRLHMLTRTWLSMLDRGSLPTHGVRWTNGTFTLPFESGDNEVAVVIANDCFGWGLNLRLADPEGVHLAVR